MASLCKRPPPTLAWEFQAPMHSRLLGTLGCVHNALTVIGRIPIPAQLLYSWNYELWYSYFGEILTVYKSNVQLVFYEWIMQWHTHTRQLHCLVRFTIYTFNSEVCMACFSNAVNNNLFTCCIVNQYHTVVQAVTSSATPNLCHLITRSPPKLFGDITN